MRLKITKLGTLLGVLPIFMSQQNKWPGHSSLLFAYQNNEVSRPLTNRGGILIRANTDTFTITLT